MLRFGKGRALALAGVQHDTAGNTLFRVGILNGVIDGLQVMSVDLLRVEAKDAAFLARSPWARMSSVGPSN